MWKLEWYVPVKKLILSLFLTVISVTSWAAESCDIFVPYGYPKPNFTTQPLCRSSYLEFHNRDQHTGGLAIEYLTPATVGTGDEPRTNNFRSDKEVPQEFRAKPIQYEGTGYDKGHLAPAGDMSQDGKSMSESFLMSNMTPQRPALNRGRWRDLERLVHSWTFVDKRNLYVLTGAVYAAKPSTLPGTVIGIPVSFFKVVIDKDKQDVVAYLLPNNNCCFNSIASYQITMSALQQLIGYDLTPDADESTKTKLYGPLAGSTFISVKSKK